MAGVANILSMSAPQNDRQKPWWLAGRQQRSDRQSSGPSGPTVTLRPAKIPPAATGPAENRRGGARNAISPRFESPNPLYRAGFDPRAVGADLRPPARRLGRQRHQDRDAARPRRADGRAARRRRFSEPASQQAQHDAEPESAGRARGVQAHG